MKNYLYLAIVFLSSNTIAQSYNGPESVEFDYTNNRWLIGNKNSHEILARDAAGVLTVLIPANSIGSTGPFGIEIVDNVLYACCGGTVKGFNLNTLDLVFSVNTGGAFLNGITHDNDGNLFVTDFSAKKIYKLNIVGQTSTTVATDLIEQPNGIIFDQVNNRCVFVNWGTNAPIKSLNLNDNSVTTVMTTNYGNCDGIAQDANGDFYIAMWQGQQVVKMNNNFTESTVIINQGLSGPADIFFNTQDLVLGIPNSGNQTVTFYQFHLSVPEIENQPISVFPNPATTEFHIVWNENDPLPASIIFYDLSGKVVQTLTSGQFIHENNTLNIPIESLNAGFYFARMSWNNRIEVVRFVKK